MSPIKKDHTIRHWFHFQDERGGERGRGIGTVMAHNDFQTVMRQWARHSTQQIGVVTGGLGPTLGILAAQTCHVMDKHMHCGFTNPKLLCDRQTVVWFSMMYRTGRSARSFIFAVERFTSRLVVARPM